KDGAIGVINKLEKYNGCILADSVGLGKTFTALAVMQYYSLRNKSILVLCPKRLEQNWLQYRGNTTTNIFYKDKIRFDVLFHTDLGRPYGMSAGMDLATINWGNYDLVVIDESHNFRNHRVKHVDRETRYDFLMKRVMQDGVKTKVLMLSATPVNNRYNDLKNQLLLAYGGDEDEMAKRLGLTKNVQAIFTRAQKDFTDWSKLPQGERHARDLVQRLDIDFSMILDNVTIARSRKHIQKYYNLSDIGRFPSRLPTKSYTPDLTSDKTVMKYKDIYERLLKTTMAVYAPLDMLLASKIETYERKYNLGHTEKKRFKAEDEFMLQKGRETGLKRLMSVNLLKRLESSVEAFRLTLSTVIDTNKEMLGNIEAYKKGDKDRTIRKKVNSEYGFDDEDEDEFEDLDTFAGGKKDTIEIRLADLDTVTWERLIREDIDILQGVYDDMMKVTPDKDNKLKCLKEVIDGKMEHPINSGNRKILIYSAFADTAEYLYKQVSVYVKERYGMETARICGGNQNRATIPSPYGSDRLLTLFSPASKDKANIYPNDPSEIDVVIGTDCISEGQNLQDCDICINYDIHWNPVRIIQRFGRIDRIGSRNDKIQLVNFWPDISLDEYINLRSRVVDRMTMVNVTATGDENLLTEEENREIDYRRVQLEKLKDGELLDLEDMDGTISITDLGLNDFVMDLSFYHKANGDPRGQTHGLHAVAKADPERGIEPGVIFVLCNRNNGVNINKQNRLHPYYMVYVKSDGEVLYTHLDVKSILDVLRAVCKGETEPLRDLCRSFNKETRDGSKMDRYNELLRAAVASIVEVKEEGDMRSLFRSGSAVLHQQRIAGLDDFELISFVVLR
ncbi:MAG: DEAD/DEAH box helicase, partial [Bacteroidales bacterium]|nr:DEAD/DEAH box helicase [Bacteroidales bacterium]